MLPPLPRASVSNGHQARRGAVNRQAVAGAVRDRSGAPPAWLPIGRRQTSGRLLFHGSCSRLVALAAIDGRRMARSRADRLTETTARSSLVLIAAATGVPALQDYNRTAQGLLPQSLNLARGFGDGAHLDLGRGGRSPWRPTSLHSCSGLHELFMGS